MTEEMTMWDEFVDPALIMYCTIKHVITGVILFLLIYDRKVVLSIDEPYDCYMRNHIMKIVKEIFLNTKYLN